MARCSNWALQLWIMLEEAIAEGEIIVMGTKGLQKATFFFKNNVLSYKLFRLFMSQGTSQLFTASARPCLWMLLSRAVSHVSSLSTWLHSHL